MANSRCCGKAWTTCSGIGGDRSFVPSSGQSRYPGEWTKLCHSTGAPPLQSTNRVRRSMDHPGYTPNAQSCGPGYTPTNKTGARGIPPTYKIAGRITNAFKIEQSPTRGSSLEPSQASGVTANSRCCGKAWATCSGIGVDRSFVPSSGQSRYPGEWTKLCHSTGAPPLQSTLHFIAGRTPTSN